MNLHSLRQDNRVSEACEYLRHAQCPGHYETPLKHTTGCRCVCHALQDALPQLVKLVQDIDEYLGATPQLMPAQRQAPTSGDRAEGSSCTSQDLTSAPAETRSSASPLKFVDVVFDGPPGPVPGRFVECESPQGVGVSVGTWIDRRDGYWALRIPVLHGNH